MVRSTVLVVALALAFLDSRVAADGHETDPAVLQADEVTHDSHTGITTALGSVTLTTRGYVLEADRLIYDRPGDRVTASGGVVVVDRHGQTLHSDHVEVTGDLREGVIEGIRLLLSNGARLAATRAERSDGRITVMERAVYSPCELCPDDPDDFPVWQLKARSVTHDQETRDVTYRDVTLEVFGVPVAYSPFMRHPDPTVDRRTGFLVPDYGSSSTLGTYMSVPYYIEFSPARDLTVIPSITREEGPVLSAEYRELMAAGDMLVEGSVVHARARHNSGGLKGGRDTRWHLKANGLWMTDPSTHIGADVHRASDDSYLSRFGITDIDTLVSDAFVEHFDGRSYAGASGYLYQGLKPIDDPGQIPLVAPLLTYSYLTPPSKTGSSASVDSSLLVLTRSDGTDSRRFSTGIAWQAPFLTADGQYFRTRISLRGDAYHASDVPLADRKQSGFASRFIPEGLIEWRYPFARMSDTSHQFFEPMAMAVWSPNGGNSRKIPNEDGQDFEFDEINLFSANRFPGLDRVEGGLRINYGLRLGQYGRDSGHYELFLGQAWRAHDDSTFDESQGLSGHFSDYVGRLQINPFPYFDLLYRFRLSDEFKSLYRSELSVNVGTDDANLEVSYVRLDDETDPLIYPLRERAQVNTGAVLRLIDNWTLEGHWRGDVDRGESVVYGSTLAYQDECLELSLSGERRFTRAVDYNPESVIVFKIRLATLG